MSCLLATATKHSLLQLVEILLDGEQINLTFFTIYRRLEEVFFPPSVLVS